MNRLLKVRSIVYGSGWVQSVGDRVTGEHIDWIEQTGYEFVKTGVGGFGEYNCIIKVQEGMEFYHYLAAVSEETVTRVDMVLPRSLRSKLSSKAYAEGTSESEIVKEALAEHFEDEKES